MIEDNLIHEALEEDSVKNASRSGILHSIYTSLHQIYLKTFFKKAVRRSRRLKGMEPENAGFQEEAREGTSKSLADEKDQDIEDEEYEFYPKVWLHNIVQSIYPLSQVVKDTTLAFFKSIFFKTHLRRSRRLKGLSAENEGVGLKGWSRKVRPSVKSQQDMETEIEEKNIEELDVMERKNR